MKRKLTLLILLISVLVNSGCDPVTEYSVYGTIKGTVVDYDTGMAISGASIMIVPGNQTVMSDANGSFEFLDLDSGQYTLSIQKSGYQANRKIVDVITGESIQALVTLTKIPTNN